MAMMTVDGAAPDSGVVPRLVMVEHLRHRTGMGYGDRESAEYYASEDNARRAECECIWESDGYTSIDQCVEVYELPAPIWWSVRDGIRRA